MRRDREWKLFLDLCAPLSHEISDLPEPNEWARMLGRLEQTRFEALAYHNLRARGLDDAVPERVMAQLRAANAQALARYHLLGEMVSPHLETLAREVDLLVLKGTAWAHTVYPEPHLRQSGDIDLLVKEADQAAAGRMLEGRGFHGRRDPMWKDHGPAYSLACGTGGTLYFELHPTICRPSQFPHLRDVRTEEQTVEHSVWGVRVRLLALEINALHVLFELAMEYWVGGYARFLVDTAHLSASERLDRSTLDSLAARTGVLGIDHCCRALLGVARTRAPHLLARLGTSAFAAGISSPWTRNGRMRGSVAALCSVALWGRWDDRRRYLTGWVRGLIPRARRKAHRNPVVVS